MTAPVYPLRLRLDGEALARNWRWLAARNPAAACGAAVKADAYGLGAASATMALANAGCREFFVATWEEAWQLRMLGLSLSVLHGFREGDVPTSAQTRAKPVLSTMQQIARWRGSGGGLCDVMIDTGMNRLGISAQDVANGGLDGIEIDIVMSHLACADEDSPMNRRQQERFAALRDRTGAKRMSLANSAGIMLGPDYAFDLVRPGLALYGGRPRADMPMQQVAFPEAEVLQRRRVPAGEAVGYSATWVAPADRDIAILNIGYADGYLRGFSNAGTAGKGRFPVVGRVSMDLVAVDVTDAPDIGEGDWIGVDLDLPAAAAASGLSQYELLTGLGARYDRVWT